MEEQYLNAFIFELSDEKQIFFTSFSQLYDFGITAYTENLKTEIIKNLILVDNKIYIDYVESKLKSIPCMDFPDILIDKWITNFNISNSNFPYYDSRELESKLKTFVNRVDFHSGDIDNDKIEVNIDREELINLQNDFYLYGAKLEINKVLKFLEKYKTDSINNMAPIVKEDLTEEGNEIDKIFKSIEAEKNFKQLVDYLGIIQNNIIKRGTQAKFSGIWSCSTSKNNLFKDFATLQDYVDYLNREFLTSYNNRSLSEGSNHHIKIKDFFS